MLRPRKKSFISCNNPVIHQSSNPNKPNYARKKIINLNLIHQSNHPVIQQSKESVLCYEIEEMQETFLYPVSIRLVFGKRDYYLILDTSLPLLSPVRQKYSERSAKDHPKMILLRYQEDTGRILEIKNDEIK